MDLFESRPNVIILDTCPFIKTLWGVKYPYAGNEAEIVSIHLRTRKIRVIFMIKDRKISVDLNENQYKILTLK